MIRLFILQMFAIEKDYLDKISLKYDYIYYITIA